MMFNELCEVNANLPNSKMLQLVNTLFFCMEALFLVTVKTNRFKLF